MTLKITWERSRKTEISLAGGNAYRRRVEVAKAIPRPETRGNRNPFMPCRRAGRQGITAAEQNPPVDEALCGYVAKRVAELPEGVERHRLYQARSAS